MRNQKRTEHFISSFLMKYLPKEKIVRFSEGERSAPETELPVSSGEEDDYVPLREAGVDPGAVLNYCQRDEELYRTLLTEFARDYSEKSESMRRAFEGADWENYGVYVHALKSSSRILDAAELSGIAARMEAAAKAGDAPSVREGHEPMMARYEALTGAIRKFLRMREEEEEPEVFEFVPAGIRRDG